MSVRVVATGQESVKRLKAKGVEQGIQSSVTTRKGRTSTKTSYSNVDGSVTRIEEVTKTPTLTTTKTSYRDLGAEQKESFSPAIEQQKNNTYTDLIKIQEQTGTFNPLVASAVAQTERSVKERTTSATPTRLDVEEAVRFSQLTNSSRDTSEQGSFLLKSEEGRRFLVENSDDLKRLLPSEESRELFVKMKPVPELNAKERLKDSNYKLLTAQASYVAELAFTKAKNRQIGKDFEEEYLRKNNIGRELNILSNPKNFAVNLDNRPTKSELNLASTKAVTKQIAGDVKAGALYLTSKEKRPPTPSERSGRGMIAYSGATLITNTYPLTEIATEIVDIGLAVPTFLSAVISPNPLNKAVATAEVVDVLADVRIKPSPNININTDVLVNTNTAVKTDVSLKNNPLPYDFRANTQTTTNIGGASGNAQGELGYGNANQQEVFFTDLNSAVTKIKSGGNALINSNVDININDNSLNFNNEANLNNDNNFNNEFNNNFNNEVNFENNLNNNYNTNFENNYNNNFNFNANFENNFNFNANFNYRNKRQSIIDKNANSYQAIAKSKGKFINVGAKTTKAQAIGLATTFADVNATRTIGVRGEEGFVNIDDTKFRKSKSKKGKGLFVEKSKYAINTAGEKAQISFKKTKGFKL